jgi:transcriptional regulator with XRE-family HTH domain
MVSVGYDETWPRRQLLITQRLRQRRCDLGLTQKQLVTRLGRAGVRTTNRALSSLEHGAGLDVAKLPALAGALDCTVTYLVGLTDDPHRWDPDPPAQAHSVERRPLAPPVFRDGGCSPASLLLGADVPPRRPGRASRGDDPIDR